MHTKEAPKTSYETTHLREESAPSDTLRDSLLSTLPSHEVFIPANIFAIRLDSHTFSSSVLTELSAMVDGIREERRQYPDSRREAESLASLNGKMKLDRMDGKTSSNMTVLYDRDTKARSGEIHTPSAVIIHEPLPVDALRRLREALPSGVPILDSETNELLDDVGQAERESQDRASRLHHTMGRAAFRAFQEGSMTGFYDREFEDIVTHYTDEYQRNPYDFRRESRDDIWMNPTYFASGLYTPRTESAQTSSFKTENNETTIEEPASPIPESEEVRAYRKKEEMKKAEAEAHAENNQRNINKATEAILDTAKEIYDVPHLGDLDDKQMRRVRRKTLGDLHPDRGFAEGGDRGAFEKVDEIMDRAQKHKATQSAGTSDTN